mmetsp:Transcript_3802/g.11114  ORF Transcript_3802/g.11114 Transcript_3802/m.11114 type:complete len:212 (+) Transcript_3802:396-1031(+)
MRCGSGRPGGRIATMLTNTRRRTSQKAAAVNVSSASTSLASVGCSSTTTTAVPPGSGTTLSTTHPSRLTSRTLSATPPTLRTQSPSDPSSSSWPSSPRRVLMPSRHPAASSCWTPSRRSLTSTLRRSSSTPMANPCPGSGLSCCLSLTRTGFLKNSGASTPSLTRNRRTEIGSATRPSSSTPRQHPLDSSVPRTPWRRQTLRAAARRARFL